MGGPPAVLIIIIEVHPYAVPTAHPWREVSARLTAGLRRSFVLWMAFAD